MVIRQIKENQWEHVYRYITTYGRVAPLSLQFDFDINCNGVDYILKVQLGNKRKIVALQAICVCRDDEAVGGRGYYLIEDKAMFASLLEFIIHQGTEKRSQ